MATIEELTTKVLELETEINTLPTQADMTALTSLLATRHQAVMTAIADLENRIAQVEDWILAHG